MKAIDIFDFHLSSEILFLLHESFENRLHSRNITEIVYFIDNTKKLAHENGWLSTADINNFTGIIFPL